MKLKRIVALALTIALVGSLIMGCQKKAESSSNSAGTSSVGEYSGPSQTLTFYGGWTGADLDKMQALVNKFNESHNNIKVEFTSLQWTQIFTKFLTDYQSGNSPDVLAMHTFEMGQFVDMGVLDSDSIKSLDLKESDYLEAAWKGTIYNNVQYAVPFDVNMHALFYNKDLFSKAGITSAPKTGEELISAAQKLTTDKNGKHPTDAGFDANNIVTYGLGFNMNHHVFYQAYALMNQQNYNPFSDNMTSVSLDADKTSKAFSFLEDLIYKYKVVPKGEKSAIDDFKAGTVAMIVDGNWQLSGLNETNFEWDTAEYPQIFEKQAVWGASEVLTMPLIKNEDNNRKAAAQTFVRWLSDNSADWAQSGQLPANKAALESTKSLKGRTAFINELGYTYFLPAHPKSTQVFSSAAPSPILTAAQDAVLNNKDAKQITKTLEKDINAVLK